MKNKYATLLLLLVCGYSLSFGQVPKKTARVLIVVSNHMMMSACPSCSSPWDWYTNNYLTLFDKWNATYINSGMDYRVEIAGVIWDKTYNDNLPGQDQLNNISSPAHPDLGKYHGMLSAFAADYLVLHSFQTPKDGAGGYAFRSIPSIGNPAIFWIETPDEHAWVHEAGHKHGLGHCAGYRQTYNNNNQFVLTGATWGFHTIMQAGKGTSPNDGCLDNNVGDTTMVVPPTYEFASPNSTLNHAGVIPLGNALHASVIPDHIAADQTIRSLFMTQSTVNLTSEMSVDYLEYANIIATSKVILKPGFKVAKGKLKIAAGPQVMAKRGVPEGYHIIRDDKAKRNEGINNFVVKKTNISGWYEIIYSGRSTGRISIVVYNMMGKVVKSLPDIVNNGKSAPFSVDLGSEKLGGHIMSIVDGSDKYFKRINL